MDDGEFREKLSSIVNDMVNSESDDFIYPENLNWKQREILTFYHWLCCCHADILKGYMIENDQRGEFLLDIMMDAWKARAMLSKEFENRCVLLNIRDFDGKNHSAIVDNLSELVKKIDENENLTEIEKAEIISAYMKEIKEKYSLHAHLY